MFIITQGYGSPLLVTQGYGSVVTAELGPVLVKHGKDGRESYQYSEYPQPQRPKRKKKKKPETVVEIIEQTVDPNELSATIRYRRRKRQQKTIQLLMESGLI